MAEIGDWQVVLGTVVYLLHGQSFSAASIVEVDILVESIPGSGNPGDGNSDDIHPGDGNLGGGSPGNGRSGNGNTGGCNLGNSNPVDGIHQTVVCVQQQIRLGSRFPQFSGAGSAGPRSPSTWPERAWRLSASSHICQRATSVF